MFQWIDIWGSSLNPITTIMAIDLKDIQGKKFVKPTSNRIVLDIQIECWNYLDCLLCHYYYFYYNYFIHE